MAPVVRDTAKLTSESVEKVRNEIETYQKVLEVDARQRIDALARQKEAIAEAEASLAVQLATWKIAKSKDALRLFRDAQKAAQEIAESQKMLSEVAAIERKILRATQAKFTSQSSDLLALSKQLKKLTISQSREGQAELFAMYFKVLGEELQKLQDSRE